MMIPPSPDAGTIHDPFEGGPLPQDAVRLRSRFAASLALSLAVAACGGGRQEAPAKPELAPAAASAPASPVSPAPPPGAVAAAAGATGSSVVSGRALFDGTIPENPKFRMGADATCAKSHPGEMTKDEILVGADRGLANVFVWVKAGITGSYPVPETPVVLDQKGCLYEPHVFGLQVGQPLELVNSDDTLHNVHALAETNDAFNLGMPKKGMRVTRRFDRPEVMVKVKCDVHGWMASYAGVVSHPYFAVSARDGAFSIRNLPAGSYTLEAWHEKLGTQTLSVTVGEKETKSVGFTFRAGA